MYELKIHTSFESDALTINNMLLQMFLTGSTLIHSQPTHPVPHISTSVQADVYAGRLHIVDQEVLNNKSWGTYVFYM